MSRIRVLEAKVKKEILPTVKKNEPDTTCKKDDVENNPLAELLAKLPKLGKTFDIHRKIGEGTFSSVYLGTLRTQASQPDAAKKWYAIKHLVPTTHPTRVAHELRCLRDIGGKNHVIGVDRCLRHLDTVVFIMPYIPHRKFTEYVGDMDADELRRYMHALFTALRHVHTFGVIHRDVKPSNFLYDRETRRYALVDFGLAQHIVPPAEPAQPPPAHQSLKRACDDADGLLPGAKRMALDLTTRARPSPPPKPTVLQPNVNLRERIDKAAAAQACGARAACACAGVGGVCEPCAALAPARANRAGTQGFRPPEVLFKYTAQGTAVDMWAAGVILASALSRRYPFFRAADDLDALTEVMAYLGTAPLQAAAAALGRRLVTSTPRRGLCLRKISAHLSGVCAAADVHSRRDAPPCGECRMPPPQCVCLDPARPAHAIEPSRAYAGFPDAAFALAARLLEPDPRARITAADALRHPFLQP